MIRKIKTWVLAFLLLLGVANSLLVSIHPTKAYADDSGGSAISQEVQGLLMKHQSFYSLGWCFSFDIDDISGSEMDGWAWWYKGHWGGDFNNHASGGASDPLLNTYDCESDATNTGVQDAFSTLGYTDPVQTYCHLDIAFASKDGGGAAGDYNKCVEDGPDWDGGGGDENFADFKKLIDTQPQTKDDANAIEAMPDYENYVLNYLSFTNACDPTFDGEWTQADKETATTLKLDVVSVTGSGKDRKVTVTPTKVEISGDKANDKFIIKAGSADFNPDEHTCSQAVAQANSYADAYSQYVTTHTNDTYSDGSTGGQTGGTAAPTCQVDGFGWIICPIINLVGSVVNFVADQLQKYLILSPLPLDGTGDLYAGWQKILNVANILLVVAFMAIIFSQATSFGISNYGIKKMLPRIIAAAILMNFSYYLCAILVDASNLLGVGISDLIYSQGVAPGGGADHTGFIGLTQSLVSAAVGAAVIGAGIILIWIFLGPVLLAILALYVIIAARDAIVTLLIIIAPLAFAAWVLPNTEKWFKKWWTLLLEMLMLFPITMALFAASSVASAIVVNGSTNVGGNTPGNDNISRLLIGLLIQALPIIALPGLIKLVSGTAGRIDTLARQFGKPITEHGGNRLKRYTKFGGSVAKKRFIPPGSSTGRLGRAGRKVSSLYYQGRSFDRAAEIAEKYKKEGREERIQEGATQMGAPPVPNDTRSARGQALGQALSDFGGPRYGEMVAAQVAEAFTKRTNSIKANLDRQPMDQKRFATELAEAIKAGEREKTAALISHLSVAGGEKGRAALEHVMANAGVTDAGMKNTIEQSIYRDNYEKLRSKRGAVARGGFDAAGNWQANMGKVQTPDLASQDTSILRHYASTGAISQADAHTILTTASLSGKIVDQEAREIFEDLAAGVPVRHAPKPPDPTRNAPGDDGSFL